MLGKDSKNSGFLLWLKIGPKIGLRGKLLIATLSIFILPIASYFYLLELESFLKHNKITAQLESTRLLAGYFKDSSPLIVSNQLLLQQQQPALYARQLGFKPIVDGYPNEWQHLRQYSHEILSEIPLDEIEKNKKKASYSILLGAFEKRFYILISVKDSDIRYKLPHHNTAYDRLDLFLSGDTFKGFRFESEAPGWLAAKPLQAGGANLAQQIKGEWQEHAQGYTIELSIPLADVPERIAFRLYDNGKAINSYSSMGKGQQTSYLNPLIRENTSLNMDLANLKSQLSDKQSRLYLLNKDAYVLARQGQFNQNYLVFRRADNMVSYLTNIYHALLGLEINHRRYSNQLERLQGAEIDAALKVPSKPYDSKAAAWLEAGNSQELILATASPVFDNDNQIIGALVLEKSNASILALQDKTFERLLILTLVLFLTTAVFLLFYAGRLVKRIVQLQVATESVVSGDGRIKGFDNQTKAQFLPSQYASDEVGQLSRSFASLLSRLNQYTSYLEGLSSKLSHELRTPLSIIKSSLENMQLMGVDKKQQVFVDRALDGTQRLSLILSKMGEAARLEQAIASSHKQIIEINEFMHSYMQGIKLAYPQERFLFHSSLAAAQVEIAPDLIAQLLDKLLSNAISFRSADTPILITLKQAANQQNLVKYNTSSSQNSERCLSEKHVLIEVFNYGPHIAHELGETIFDSMVSKRAGNKAKDKEKELNLGLGLHIAMLIAKFHQAQLSYVNHQNHPKLEANNIASGGGVSFVVLLPMIQLIE